MRLYKHVNRNWMKVISNQCIQNLRIQKLKKINPNLQLAIPFKVNNHSSSHYKIQFSNKPKSRQKNKRR